MISHNAIGMESDIEHLLEKSLLNMDKAQIRAWMKYQFDPSSMFCIIEDNQVVSCLQIKRRIMSINKEKNTVALITMAATLPDYRQRGYFSNLLEASLNQANQNDLVTLLYTTFPKLFECRSFQTIQKTKSYWIPSTKVNKGNDKLVHTLTKDMQLYPVYTTFMSHFDGSVFYTKTEFEKLIQYHQQSGKKIIVCFNDKKEITGFAIYRITNGYAKIEILIYLNAQTIYNLLRFLSIRCNSITFIVSENERFEKLFPLDYPRIQGYVLSRLNNYKLYSKWTGHDIRNISQAYNELEKPCWNHFIA